jgi:hypothetical protein
MIGDWFRVKFAKPILGFAVAGIATALAVAGLASVAPSVFGWLTLPFWVLPAITGLGAHDFGWPLPLLSGSIFYAIFLFVIFHVTKSRAAN